MCHFTKLFRPKLCHSNMSSYIWNNMLCVLFICVCVFVCFNLWCIFNYYDERRLWIIISMCMRWWTYQINIVKLLYSETLKQKLQIVRKDVSYIQSVAKLWFHTSVGGFPPIQSYYEHVSGIAYFPRNPPFFFFVHKIYFISRTLTNWIKTCHRT